MSIPLFTVVFPDGTTEYRTGAQALVVGDVVRHLGEDLVVDSIDNDPNGNTIVTLRSPPADAGT